MVRWLVFLLLVAGQPVFVGDGSDPKDCLSWPGVKLLPVAVYTPR